MNIATGWSRNILSFSWFPSVTPHTARNWLFFHESFQSQLRDYFHGPVCPAQRTVCHLMQTPITGPTPGSCDYGPEGPAPPTSEGPPLSPGSGTPSPCKLETISLVRGKGGLPASHTDTINCFLQTGWTGLQEAWAEGCQN